MKRFFCLIISLLLSTVVFAADGNTQWGQLDSNNYVNLEGIVGVEDIYGFSFLLKSYNKGQYEPVNGKEIWYTLSQYTIDCSKRKYKIGVIDSYGYSDNFVNGDYNRYAKFQPIVEGTAIDIISNKLCRPK